LVFYQTDKLFFGKTLPFLGKSFMGRKPRRVAVMLDLQWPYKRHAAIFVGTQQYANEHGWDTVVDEFVHNTLPTRRGPAVPYDGIIARVNRPLALRAAELGVPVVNVWPSSPARHLVPGVFPDSTQAGRLIAEHLMARGFRTFATLSSPQNVDNFLEVSEFARLVGEAGFSCASTQIPQNPWQDLAHWKKAIRKTDLWMDGWKPPVGVYVNGESEGRMVVQACRRRGWRVPADVAIIAGKNEETLCEHLRPTLSSIEIGYDRIGYEAASLLDRLMDGAAPPEKPILLPPLGLVVRESTDFFAVENKLVASALAYISANSHRSIGPDDVARVVGAETRTLHNHFRKVLDRTVAAEIRRVRIERAKRELANSKRRLADIARDVGFGDEKRLYEIFRRELGITPREYRKQRQLENRL
jgi:LacI family transcriptional regulator